MLNEYEQYSFSSLSVIYRLCRNNCRKRADIYSFFCTSYDP